MSKDTTLQIKPQFNDEIFLKKLKKEVSEIEADSGIYTADQLLNREVKEIPTLVEPILPKVGLVAVAGSSDTGKSSFLRQLCMDVAVGEDSFLGFKLNAENRRAIYVSTEDDDTAISFLLNKANQEKRLNPDSFSGLTFVFDTTNLAEKLEEILSSQKTDLVVIDAFSDLYGKSMNDSNQVRTFLNDYSQLAAKYKTLVVFLHHTGKRTEDLAPSKHHLLGSQGFEAKMRLVAELRNDQQEPDKRHLCIVKANYLPRDYKTESYVLRFNENLLFSNTNDRVHFDELKAENKIEIKQMVKDMKSDGKTQKEISAELKISQATVSRYLNE